MRSDSLLTSLWATNSAGLLCLILVGSGVCAQEEPDLAPILGFTVTPAATGRQIVRTSIPLRPGALKAGQDVVIDDGRSKIPAAIRPLTWHAGEAGDGSIRRAMVTFPCTFPDQQAVGLRVYKTSQQLASRLPPPLEVRLEGGVWSITSRSGFHLHAQPIWPDMDPDLPWHRENIEENAFFRWQEWTQQDDQWSRVVEVRVDALEQVIFVAHLQRRGGNENWAPRYGWDLMLGGQQNEAKLTGLQQARN